MSKKQQKKRAFQKCSQCDALIAEMLVALKEVRDVLMVQTKGSCLVSVLNAIEKAESRIYF